ncbi:MAG TPA: hypothetical protein VMV41_13385 [Cellulomonadaceae bacterium]|nr:hypothetical protein [Cellulomonadaceae bacterium]
MPSVLILSAEDDTGGVGVALAQALNRHTDWTARAVHRTQNYIQYPIDILWPPGLPPTPEILGLAAKADVLHVMERWDAVDWLPDWADRPLVMHHHGTIFREWNTRSLIESVARFRAYPICSTLDLTLIDSSVEWLPNPCDTARMRKVRAEAFSPHEELRAAHSPTNAPIKGTAAFQQACAAAGFDLDLIQWVDWQSCLYRKARADLVLDQLTYGYGLSGIEAMAMGIPVVGGCRDQRVIDLMQRTFGNLPFLLANEGTLPGMVAYMRDPEARAASAAVGQFIVEWWHEEAKVAARLVGIYEKARSMR